MAEVRIPTDQIPPDILERLQAILDGQSLVSYASRGIGLTPTSALPHLIASTTSSSTYGIPAGVNVSKGISLFAETSVSSSPCMGSTEPVLSLSKLPSSQSLHSATTSQYVLQSPTTKFTGSASANSDEVDGGKLDSFGQFSGSSPRNRKCVEPLDDSGIVRLFAVDDSSYDHKRSDDQSSKSQSNSEIVRIFPDVDTTNNVAHEATIIRALSPVTSHGSLVTSRSETIHTFSNNREISAPSRQDWDYKNSKEIHSQSIYASKSQGSIHSICDTSPRRPGSVSHILSAGHHDFSNSPSKIPSTNPRLQELLQASSKYVSEQEKTFNPHLMSSFPVKARRSPELPTPPQTPDEGDVDMDDDEVFTYNVAGCDDGALYRPQASQTNRKILESTPRRSFEHLRRNSDRSCEQRLHLTNLSSSAGPAQKMAEMSFGDRHKTRKRLSFDEDMANQSHNQRPHHHSDPTTIPSSFIPLPLPTSSSLQGTAASRKCHTGPITCPTPTYNTHTMSSPFNVCRPSPNKHSVGMHQPSSTSHQITSDQKNQKKPPPMSNIPSATNKSPVHDVFAFLDRAIGQQTSAPAPRARLHSDGDSIVDRRSQSVLSRDTSSPTLEQYNTRRQTFSHGKRRRRDEEDMPRKEENAGNHIPVTWSPDKSNGAVGDCACSKFARNFLQMAEGAYRNISQMDGTHTGFGRFTQELARTNDILLDSLNIVQQFRAMCEHSVRYLPESPATPAQR